MGEPSLDGDCSTGFVQYTYGLVKPPSSVKF